MGNNLKQLRTARGWTQEEAAQRVNVSRGQYIKLERGERRLTSDYIRMAANAFSVPDAAVISEIEIPLKGYVDAAADVHLFSPEAEANTQIPKVPALLLSLRDIAALEIRGSVLGPAFRNGVLYFAEARTTPAIGLADRLCVVGRGDEGISIRVLTHMPQTDRFSLTTYPDRIEDGAAIHWVSPVLALLPRPL